MSRDGFLSAALAFLAAVGVTLSSRVPCAGEETRNLQTSLEVRPTGRFDRQIPNSLINPENVMRLPAYSGEVQARWRLNGHWHKAKGVWRLLVEDRMEANREEGDAHGRSFAVSHQENHLRQALLRIQSQSLSWTVGREHLTWGPAQFRAVSSPFYFASDKSDPLLDEDGVDLIRVDYDTRRIRVGEGYVFSDRALEHQAARGHHDHTLFLKLDIIGDNPVLGFVASVPPSDQKHSFGGAYAHYTLTDKTMAYGEASVTRAAAPLIPQLPHSALPFVAQAQNPVETSVLLGANYALENGQTLSLEWIHNGGGYSKQEERLFFNQLHNMLPEQALTVAGLVPQPFGRTALWLGWRSNPQDWNRSWQWDTVINPNDNSAGMRGYLETVLTPHLSLFVSAGFTSGSRKSEFASLYRVRTLIGLKAFL